MAKKHIIDTDQTETIMIKGDGSSWSLVKGIDIEVDGTHGMWNKPKADGVEYHIEGNIVAMGLAGNSGILETGDNGFIDIEGLGYIAGHFGITTTGRGTEIRNAGTIYGAEAGLQFIGDRFTFINDGNVMPSIDGSLGISITEKSSGGRIVNNEFGTIDGTISVDGGADVTVVNHGAINHSQGNIFGVRFEDGNDRFVNRGEVDGYVNMGLGNDVMDLRGGTTTQSASGSYGNDTYIIDDMAAKISEIMGEGYDTVKTSAGFDGSMNLGMFERFILIGKEAVNIFASNIDETLIGNRAANVLTARGGTDKVTGGLGADTFVFATGDDKDTVTDFGNGKDRIDVSGWTGMDSFADIQSHLKIKGDDLVIADGTDMIILKDFDKADLSAADFMF